MSEEPLNIISLGAGVQSTTMSLMAEKCELSPKVDCANIDASSSESELDSSVSRAKADNVLGTIHISILPPRLR